jgi:hypothetical protein
MLEPLSYLDFIIMIIIAPLVEYILQEEKTVCNRSQWLYKFELGCRVFF